VIEAFHHKSIFLRGVNLSVIGTGGKPCLFRLKSDFDIYYDLLKGQYCHIVCGVLFERKYYVDKEVGPRLVDRTLELLHYSLFCFCLHCESRQAHVRMIERGDKEELLGEVTRMLTIKALICCTIFWILWMSDCIILVLIVPF